MSIVQVLNPQRVRWPSRHQIHASLLSLSILSLALFTLWLGHSLPANLAETIEVREVALTLPAVLPPPPPPAQQQVIEMSLSVNVQGAGVAIPQIKIKPVIELIKPDIPAVDTRQTQWQSLAVDWNAVDLNQLDGMPNLLTPLRMTFPKSLSRKGIKRVLVKLDVVIDEKGQVTLVNIIQNPYPELVSEIHRLVRYSRFTAPKKDNQAVRARFIWPVEIES